MTVRSLERLKGAQQHMDCPPLPLWALLYSCWRQVDMSVGSVHLMKFGWLLQVELVSVLEGPASFH